MHRQPCFGYRMRVRFACSLFTLTACCLSGAMLSAGELVDMSVSHQRGVFDLRVEMILDASYEDVYHVLTDYVHIYRLNPSIVESEVMPVTDDSVVRIKTLINDCVLIFCKEILRVEDVRELGTGDLYAVIVPELSSVKSGFTIWQVQHLGGRTRVQYQLRLEPGFYIPPLIGTQVVKRKMHKEVLVSFGNIERIAQIRATRGESAQSQVRPVAGVP
jgi:hypothetical protein